MKKLLVVTMLLLALVSAAAAQAPAQPAQKQINDAAEYNAYIAATKATDNNTKAAMLESFLATYPNTVVKEDATQLLMTTYQQLGNANKMLDAGQKLLQINPKNLTGLAFVAYLLRIDATPEKMAQAGALAVQGLQALDSAPKPEGLSDADWAKQKDTFRYTIFDPIAGQEALQVKDYATAQKYLKEAAANNAQDVQTVYLLALAYLEAPKPWLTDGLFWIARATALAPAQAQGQIGTYGKRKYTIYHGTPDGWDRLVADAANQPAIPAGFTVTPAPTPADQAHDMLKQKSPDQMAFAEWQFILQNGAPDDVNAVWTAAKGRPIQAQALVVSATPKVLMLAGTADDIDTRTADIELTLVTPLTAAVAQKLVGQQITFKGTPMEYLSDTKANPPVFMMKLTDGALTGKSAEEAKPSPVHHPPAHH